MIFYDFEVTARDWLGVFYDSKTKKIERIINDSQKLKEYYQLHKHEIFIGYNSSNYDQYIFKAILLDMNPKYVSDEIIVYQNPGWKISRDFETISLIGYDCFLKKDDGKGGIGLKVLEGHLGLAIEESKIDWNIDRPLTEEELKELADYCEHDVFATAMVFKEMISEFETALTLISEFNLPKHLLSKPKTTIASYALQPKRIATYDENEYEIADTIDVMHYPHIRKKYEDERDLTNKPSSEFEVAGVNHIFAYGGTHGAIQKYHKKGIFVYLDMKSFYPKLMIEYKFLSRAVPDIKLYEGMYDKRLYFVDEKIEKLADAYKIVINSVFGASNSPSNPLYDPRMFNSVVVSGQLMMLDLIAHLENGNIGGFSLIQTNTDGLVFEISDLSQLGKVELVVKEMSERCRMNIKMQIANEIWQKDVNNYYIKFNDGRYAGKGRFTKKLTNIDNELAIIKKALKAYFDNNTPIEVTINESNSLIDFQQIMRLPKNFDFIVKSSDEGWQILHGNVIRFFLAKSKQGYSVMGSNKKDINNNIYGGKTVKSVSKIAYVDNPIIIDNSDIRKSSVPEYLDRQRYIDMAKTILEEYGVKD